MGLLQQISTKITPKPLPEHRNLQNMETIFIVRFNKGFDLCDMYGD